MLKRIINIMNEFIFNENPNQIVKNYIASNFIAQHVSIPRDIKIEKELILAGKVHLKLLSTLDSKVVGDWLQVYEKKNNYIELPNGNKIVRKPVININNIEGNFNGTINLYPGTVVIYNQVEGKYYLPNNPIFSPLIHAFSCLFCNNNERTALNILADKFKISLDITSRIKIPKDNWMKKISITKDKIGTNINLFKQPIYQLNVQQNNRKKEYEKDLPRYICTDFQGENSKLQESNSRNYLFLGKNNEILMNVRHYFSNGLLLPISLWTNMGAEYLYSLPVLPEILPLFNLKLILNDNLNKPIIITEHIELAQKNTFYLNGDLMQQSVIWTSWYGGMESISKVDWSVLKDKQVYYICVSTGFSDLKSILKKLNTYLKNENVELNTVSIRSIGEIESCNDTCQKLSANNNIIIHTKKEQFQIEPISNSELEIQQASNSIVSELIDECNSAAIFSDDINSNIWFLVSLAYCISEGVNLLKNSKIWQISSTGNKVIYFANKSKSNIYKRVLSKIINIYSDNKLSMDNYHLLFMHKTHCFKDFMENKILENYLEETKIKDSIIVLDNIIDVFEIKQQKLMSSLILWIENLKSHGYTVIINNQSGNTAQLDELFKLDFTDSKLRFMANHKQQNQFKILSETYGISLKPIVAKFHLEGNNSGWNIISTTAGKNSILDIVERFWIDSKSIDETKAYLEINNARNINNYRNKVLDKYFSKGHTNSEIARIININLSRVEKRRLYFERKISKSKI